MDSFFTYSDYKVYLFDRLKNIYGSKKGHKAKMASVMNCQPSYLSKVLKGAADLSLEQGALLNSYLHHSSIEGEYFLLLIQLSRAGSPKVKVFVKSQIDLFKKTHNQLATKIDANESQSLRSNIYRKWIHLAVLAAVSIRRLRHPRDLSEYFQLPLSVILETLSLLETLGYIRKENDVYCPQTMRAHLKNEAQDILHHHTHWRLKALEAIQNRPVKSGEFYTSVISISKMDLELIRNKMAAVTKEIKDIIRNSDQSELETVVSFNWDLFELNPQ